MTEKFQNRYRIPSARLQGYDYGAHGSYFVTICTKNRECYFGNIVETHNCASHDTTTHPSVETHNFVETGNCPSLRPTIIGQTAIDYWSEIPKHFPFVELDEFVIMPNHLHGILFLNRPEKTDWQPNQFGVQSQNLGAIIRAFKSTTKRFANQNNIEFEWQSRYHDRIIRNEKELNAIRRYIVDNPRKWEKDGLNVSDVETGNCSSLRLTIEHETENLLKGI